MEERLSAAIAKKIEDMMEEQTASGGPELLPAQRELAEMFGASRASVREACSLLEARGRITTSHGRRSVWLGAATKDAAAMVGSAILETGYPRSEIARYRHMVEGRAARLAAMRITEEELGALDRRLEEMRECTRKDDLVGSAEIDFQFHLDILRYSGVQIFIDLHLAMRGLIMQSVPMTSVNYNRLWEPIDEHGKIIRALRRHDPDEALYYARSHIERSADRLGISDANIII